jgi:hypothetical protein
MMKPTVALPAGEPCLPVCTAATVTNEVACTSGSNAAHSGSCQTAGGSFCCHDHTYSPANSQHPDPAFAFATYTYGSDVVLDKVEIEQHTNGINCMRGELDGVDAGTFCVANPSTTATAT